MHYEYVLGDITDKFIHYFIYSVVTQAVKSVHFNVTGEHAQPTFLCTNTRSKGMQPTAKKTNGGQIKLAIHDKSGCFTFITWNTINIFGAGGLKVTKPVPEKHVNNFYWPL